MKIDLQLSAAVEGWAGLRDGVRAAEAAGFDTTWVFDHFAGKMLGGTSMIECFTLLGALAASTERIGLGSLVVNVNSRRAGVLAASAASVQEIAAGRFVLGLGAGAAPGSKWASEHADLGIELGATLEERHRRLGATLDELERMWAIDRPDELATFPIPGPQPPIILGVNSAALAEIAARRCDGINLRSTHAGLERIVTAAATERERAGRAGEPWDVSVWAMWDSPLLDPDHPDRRRWESLGINRLVLVFLQPHDRAAIEAAADRLSCRR